MSLNPLDPKIVAETDKWFYTSHPRGQELRGPDGDRPLHPTSAEDAEGRRAWVREYRRRLAEKQAGSADPLGGEDPGGGTDPLEPCAGCCPTDFLLEPQSTTVEAEESVILLAGDMPPAGVGAGTYTWTTTSEKLSLGPSATCSGPQRSGSSFPCRLGRSGRKRSFART